MVYRCFAIGVVVGVDPGHWESAVGVGEVVVADAAAETYIVFVIFLFAWDVGEAEHFLVCFEVYAGFSFV